MDIPQQNITWKKMILSTIWILPPFFIGVFIQKNIDKQKMISYFTDGYQARINYEHGH